MYSDVFYSPFTNVSGLKEYSHAQEGYSVSWPATLRGIISVGATGYKDIVRNIDGNDYTDMLAFAPEKQGYVTKFSSPGPTFDGQTKPDVVAPGMNIHTAFNSFVDISESIRKELTDKVIHNGKTYYYTAQGGTSMASPVVAGAVALWLQAKPDLTPEEVLDVIAHTATLPDPSLDYPNNTYGYSQIDVYRGLLYVLSLPSAIPSLSQHQPQQARFHLSGRPLSVALAVAPQQPPTLCVYNLQGQPVASDTGTAIDLSTLPAGVYAVQLNTHDKSTTGSTLIRL